MIRKGSAVWRGPIKEGEGAVSTETGVLDGAPYGFSSRFEQQPGTNPEELIAAAHAACFSMALSLMLGEAGLTPSEIRTESSVKIEKQEGGFAILSSHLRVNAQVPEASSERFNEIAEKAKKGCPVSKLLNAEITMEATLES